MSLYDPDEFDDESDRIRAKLRTKFRVIGPYPGDPDWQEFEEARVNEILRASAEVRVECVKNRGQRLPTFPLAPPTCRAATAPRHGYAAVAGCTNLRCTP